MVHPSKNRSEAPSTSHPKRARLQTQFYSPAAEAARAAGPSKPSKEKKKTAAPKRSKKMKAKVRTKPSAEPRARQHPKGASSSTSTASATPISKKSSTPLPADAGPRGDNQLAAMLATFESLHSSIECKACGSTFTSPRILACQHTLCRNCLYIYFDAAYNLADLDDTLQNYSDEASEVAARSYEYSDWRGGDGSDIVVGSPSIGTAGELWLEAIAPELPKIMIESPSGGIYVEEDIKEGTTNDDSLEPYEEEPQQQAEVEGDELPMETGNEIPIEFFCPTCRARVHLDPIRSVPLSRLVRQLRNAKAESLRNPPPRYEYDSDDDRGSVASDDWSVLTRKRPRPDEDEDGRAVQEEDPSRESRNASRAEDEQGERRVSPRLDERGGRERSVTQVREGTRERSAPGVDEGDREPINPRAERRRSRMSSVKRGKMVADR
ncbi:hypothetical protein P7C70_g5319, partial [Phenoliferia sp. Uapishka_3]